MLAPGMIPAFTERDKMILRQLSLPAFLAIGTAMIIRFLHHTPLRCRKVSNRSAFFEGTTRLHFCPHFIGIGLLIGTHLFANFLFMTRIVGTFLFANFRAMALVVGMVFYFTGLSIGLVVGTLVCSDVGHDFVYARL